MSFFVIDTNVYLSALFSRRGRAYQTIDLAFSKGSVLQSDEIYQGILIKLDTDHVKGFIPGVRVHKYLDSLKKRVVFLSVEPGITLCKDKTDNKFLDLAVTGKADYIISGDHHLLNMKNIRGIGHTVQIVSPAAFVTLFENAQTLPSSDFRLARA
jgi:putative PIN family toxin of toxin-antitoxin system